MPTSFAVPPKTLKKADWPPNYVSVFAWRQTQLLKLRSDLVLAYGAREYYKHHPVEFICHWMDTYDPRKAGSGLPSRAGFSLIGLS